MNSCDLDFKARSLWCKIKKGVVTYCTSIRLMIKIIATHVRFSSRDFTIKWSKYQKCHKKKFIQGLPIFLDTYSFQRIMLIIVKNICSCYLLLLHDIFFRVLFQRAIQIIMSAKSVSCLFISPKSPVCLFLRLFILNRPLVT